jgi:hypothetical protein
MAKKRKFLLYFICAFDQTPIRSAIKVSRTRKWLKKVSPALKASLVALDICISKGKGVPMQHDSVANHTGIPVLEDEINQFADETWEAVVDVFGQFAHDATGDSTKNYLEEGRAVTKPAYEALSNLALSYPDWSAEMTLATNQSGVLGWVKNENVERWKRLEMT